MLARREGLVGDVLLFCEHPPVFTLGRGGNRTNLLVPPEVLERQAIPVYEVNRGGDITYHGPGQVVAYPILDLEAHSRDIHLYLRNLEETIILALAAYGINARRFPGYTGVWVGDRKIAAIGVATKRWISMHGFALNVAPDMSYFAMITPCGIKDYGVTSMREVLGRDRDVDLGEIKRRLVVAFERVFGVLTARVLPERFAGIVELSNDREAGNNTDETRHRCFGFGGRRMSYTECTPPGCL